MVTGGSYGGYMTLASATHFDARLRASLAVVGISSFVTFLENTEDYRRDLRRAEYGDERDPAMREFLLSISPLNNASKITKPLFIVQGKNDPRVPYTESEQMVATIRKNQGAGLVPARRRRGARLRQEVEPGLPVLRHRRVHPQVPA